MAKRTLNRWALSLALLLTPDDRAATRRRIILGALLSEEVWPAPLDRVTRRGLLRGLARAQRTWVGVGIGLYRVSRVRPWALPVFGLALLYGAYLLVVALLERFA